MLSMNPIGANMAEPSLPTIDEAINAAALPPELLDARRNEDRVLRENYAGEYVAYRDIWEPPVLRREVLAHATSLKEVHAALAHLADSQLDLIRVTYCDTPEPVAGFRGGYDNPTLLPLKTEPPRSRE